jgi:hypothetical protein
MAKVHAQACVQALSQAPLPRAPPASHPCHWSAGGPQPLRWALLAQSSHCIAAIFCSGNHITIGMVK